MAVDDQELLRMMRTRKSPTAALLGLELEDINQADGTSRMSMVVTRDFCNPMGNMQGGLITTALDDAAATAIIAKAQRRVGVPTIEFKVSFFAPAPLGGTFTFLGRVVKLGRTISFAEAEMQDATGKLLAKMTTSCMVVDVSGPGIFVDSSPS